MSVSIIIPHYNNERRLLALLESIPDCFGIEIVVIDDNSTVDISKVLAYIKQRNNIHIYSNDRGIKGAGVCRNIGLENISGEWIIFADADDYFLDGMYETVMKYADSKADIVYFCPTSFNMDTGKESSRHIYYAGLVDNFLKKRNRGTELELKYGFCTPWSKMIKKSVFDKNIQFDAIPVANDIMCITKCAFRAESIDASASTIYCVTRGSNGLTTARDEKLFDLRVSVFIERYKFLRDHLGAKELRRTHINRIALARLADSIMDHWGWEKFFSVAKLFHENHIKCFDVGLLNPVLALNKVVIEIKWWKEIYKGRKCR